MAADPLAKWLDELDEMAAAKQTGDAELDMLAGPIHLDPATVTAMVRVVRAASKHVRRVCALDTCSNPLCAALAALRALVEGR